MNKTNVNIQNLEHQKNILSAVSTYCAPGHVTISILAHSFKVSENTISAWFCEAVEKRYVASDAICHQIMAKHIKEYEEKHMISNSCLRNLYKKAFEARNTLYTASA